MNIAVILAGGTGSRAGGPLPKQFQKVQGKRMLWWSVEAFRRFDPECRIVLAVHPDFLMRWDELFGDEEKVLDADIQKVAGGRSRIESVRNALESIAVDDGATVFIHDSARPYVREEMIRAGAARVARGVGAVPAVPVTDSLRRLQGGGESECVRRSDYVSVQTPQIFILDDIRDAYRKVTGEDGLTDDASVAEKAGLKIRLYEGDPGNIKITNPSDFR